MTARFCTSECNLPQGGGVTVSSSQVRGRGWGRGFGCDHRSGNTPDFSDPKGGGGGGGLGGGERGVW